MDSAVTLAEARRAGFAVHALTVDYGQVHAVELDAARRVAEGGGALEQRVVSVDLRALGGSALTDAKFSVPKDRLDAGPGSDPDPAGVPATYVPARNTIFLSIALGWAETLGAADLFCGVNAVDYSGYPDCRPAFLRAFEELATLATEAGTERAQRFQVHAPLLELSKRDIVLRAEALGVDLARTHTCYDPVSTDPEPGSGAVSVLSCGRCDACALRLRGFREAGREDPIAYVERTD